MTELRHVHRLAMAKVWEVAPHLDATEQEGPGSFRRNGIKPFGAGMQPPDWTEVPALMTDWVNRACALPSADDPLPETVAAVHAEFVAYPPISRRQRPGRPPPDEPASHPARLPARHHPQGRASALPAEPASS